MKWRWAVATLAVTVAALVPAPGVASGPGWAVEPTLIYSGSTANTLQGVSCTSATACTAVGAYVDDSDTEVTLAERLNGTGWAPQATPNPSGATSSSLTGVSCTSATACTAVGEYENGGGPFMTMAEDWNGASWAIEATPTPSGATSSILQGVSCTSATACTAVGEYVDSTGTPVTLAQGWNGAHWVIQATPNPSGATNSILTGVSCTSATACTAVGDYDNGAGTLVALAERWNGIGWAIQTTPMPNGATLSDLLGVSCISVTDCTAVGDYENGAGSLVALAEYNSGTGWAIQTTPTPSGATSSILRGVSCISTKTCTAVGQDNSVGPLVTLADRWDGTSWTIQPTATPSAATSSSLSAVSCTSATACTAVGYYRDSASAPVMLAEGGMSWAIQTTPNPSGATNSIMSGVSCTSAKACTAVGNDVNGAGTEVTLAERLKGTSWAIQATPTPSGATISALLGVSCPSATACIGVGDYRDSAGTYRTLAEGWNGTGWTIQATPKLRGAMSSVLEGVSCTSATACTAVGTYANSAGAQLTLAEGWNGTSWVIEATPNPGGATMSFLLGVSCTSATACTAVGTYANSAGTYMTLAEHWNGTSWTIQATPNPAGATFPALQGVSCTSATACTAVGDYYNSGGTKVTLAEVWNGTGWAIVPTPNPTGTTSPVLSGVSCASATACTAVGYYVSSTGALLTLVEQRKGADWAIQPTPNPSGATNSVLVGVSCASATACAAVGYYDDGAGTRLTLSER